MRPLTLSVALLSLLSLALRAETATKAISLFNGKDLAGWDYLTPDKTATLATVCHVKPDGVIAVEGKPVGYIQAAGTYKNYRLHAEWRWTDKPGNSGVLLHIASGPLDRNTWPLCFQVQTKNKSVGDFLPMAGAKFAEPLTSAPGAATPQLAHQKPDSEKAVGEWNSCDVICRDGAIEVTINGVVQNHVTQCEPASGHVGFQLEGIPFELRSVLIERL